MEQHKTGLIEGYKELAAAIIGQAVRDYMNALISGNSRRIHEGQEFFRSAYAEILLDKADPEALIAKCRKISREVKYFEEKIFCANQKDSAEILSIVCSVSDSALCYARKHLKRNRFVFKSTKKAMLEEMKRRGLQKYIYDL